MVKLVIKKPVFCERSKCLKLTWSKKFLNQGVVACPNCGTPAKLVDSPHGDPVYVHTTERYSK